VREAADGEELTEELDAGPLDAGPLGAWAVATVAVAGGAEADVPCGTCTACCRSGWFVHVAPDEVEALRRIPAALRFPAPGRPAGHVVIPHDEHGRCPMLTDAGCSIYEHRPRTCRAFDCRVFAATGLRPEGEGTVDVARRADRWRFDTSTDDDRRRGAAIRAAVERLSSRIERPGDLAAAAVQVHELFLDGGEPADDDLAAALGGEVPGVRGCGPSARRRPGGAGADPPWPR